MGEQFRGLRASWLERRTALRDELQMLLSSAVLDRERALEILDGRQQDLAMFGRELVAAFADFSDSLEPDQRNRLAELIGGRLDRRWGPACWAL